MAMYNNGVQCSRTGQRTSGSHTGAYTAAEVRRGPAQKSAARD